MMPKKQTASDTVGDTSTYYHLYHSKDEKGTLQHQRGVHVKSATPIRVKCDRFGREMEIAKYSDDPGSYKYDDRGKVETRNGKPVMSVTHYGTQYDVQEGDPIIYRAEGHDDVDQSADLAEEWE